MTPLRSALRAFRARPRLWRTAMLGALLYALLPSQWAEHAGTRALIAWNAAALLYLGLALRSVWDADAALMRQRAIEQDEGRGWILTLVVLASVAVLVAIASQLAVVRGMQGPARQLHLALAGLTVVTAWLFTQVLFALHYAHDFYLARVRQRPDPLDFPGTREPDYVDFFYLACSIGTSGQAADVSFTSSAGRRVAVLHCIQAFFFNTTVLAMAINIAAGLF